MESHRPVPVTIHAVDPCVLFLHIPRTGGTTLGAAAHHLYRPEEILELHPATRAREILDALPEERLRQLRFVRGHVPYGVHTLLPTPCTYMTVLRDPVDRVLSLYAFMRKDPAHRIHTLGEAGAPGLAEVLERRLFRRALEDAQTQLLGGVAPWLPHEPATEATLEEAKRNLESSFGLVGLTERFAETVELMRRVFGWRMDSVPSANVIPDRPRREELDPSLVALIEERNQLDLELYEFAADLFPRNPGWRRSPAPPPTAATDIPAPVVAPVGRPPARAALARESLKRRLPPGVVRGIQRMLARMRGAPPAPEPPEPAGRPAKVAPPRRPYWAAPAVMRRLEVMAEAGYEPSVILDVGAAHGRWTGDCMQIFPSARYVLVEPGPDYAAELQRLAEDRRVTYVPAAAGARRERRALLLPNEPEGGSFLPEAEGGERFFERSVEVDVVPLDEVDLPGVSLLKLDVQGFELEVLRGAARVLSETEVVVCEVSFHPFQEGIPLAHEVVAALVDAGFALFDYGDEVRWSGSKLLAQLDLIFVREGSDLLRADLWA